MWFGHAVPSGHGPAMVAERLKERERERERGRERENSCAVAFVTVHSTHSLGWVLKERKNASPSGSFQQSGARLGNPHDKGFNTLGAIKGSLNPKL